METIIVEVRRDPKGHTYSQTWVTVASYPKLENIILFFPLLGARHCRDNSHLSTSTYKLKKYIFFFILNSNLDIGPPVLPGCRETSA